MAAVVPVNNKPVPAPTIKPCRILKYADVALLALPSAACLGIGTGFARLEGKKNAVLHGIGWLGRRISQVVGVIWALPLLIYLVAKAAFAKLANFITGHKVKCLRRFAEFSDRQMTYITSAVLGIGALMPVLPKILKGAKNGTDAMQRIAQAINQPRPIVQQPRPNFVPPAPEIALPPAQDPLIPVYVEVI